MTPLFCSFTGNQNGKFCNGWAVIQSGPLSTGQDVEDLCRYLEQCRAYDAKTLVLISFHRLEPAPPGPVVGTIVP